MSPEDALARIRDYDGRLKAFVRVFDPALGDGDGPVFAIKDLFDVKGVPTGGGAKVPLSENPAASAVVVQKLLDAGWRAVGKTQTVELAYGGWGTNRAVGAPWNPWDAKVHRAPGGSSSGSAVAVAAGLADAALGSDTGGSVRIPAALNGLYGLRPTHNRIDLSGVQAMAESFDVPGWFAASPGVFRNVGAVLLDQNRVPGRIERMIALEDAFAEADGDFEDLLRTALEFMTEDLPPVVHARISLEGFDPWREAFRTIQGFEVWRTFGDFVTRQRPEIGPGVRERMEYSAGVTAAEAAAARNVQAQARAHILQTAKPGTILALPTAPCIAPPTDVSPEDLDHFRTRVMRLTCTAGLAGLPQMNLPIGTLAGCPVGLSFIGWAGGDEVLLDLACELSRHCGMAA